MEEELAASLIQYLETGAFIIHDNEIILANNKIAQPLGYTAQEMQGVNVAEIVAADQKALDFNNALAQKTNLRDLKLETRDGKLCKFKIRFEQVQYQGHSAWLGLVQRDNATLQKFFNGCGQLAIFVFNSQHEIVYWNPGCEKLFGYSQDEIIGQPIQKYIVPEYLTKIFSQEITSWFAKGKKIEPQKQVWINKTNDDVKLFSHYIMLQSEAGAKQILCINVDMRNIEGLDRHYWQIQRLKSVGQLAAGIAEIFNDKFSVIRGRAQMAMLKIGSGKKGYSDLLEIVEATEKATALNRQLLHFSRNKEMSLRELDLNEIIGNFLQMSGNRIDGKLVIEKEFSPNIWTIKGNPSFIEKIVMNLLINSQEAMRKPGQALVKTENIELTAQQSSLPSFSEPGKYVRITIQDNGQGIDPNILDRIYDPFFTTKNRALHDGMGLAVSYGIIKKHRGWINVRSQPNRGTTFTIDLPAL